MVKIHDFNYYKIKSERNKQIFEVFKLSSYMTQFRVLDRRFVS
jgi:hypothetical protein